MADLTGHSFIKKNGALHPTDLAAEEFLAGIPDRKEMLVTIRRPRSVQQHRLLFSLLHKVCENSETWQDEEELLDAVKIACGHTQPRQRLDGTIYRVPKSINFASLDQDAFKRFFNRAVYVLAKMLGVSEDQLLNEALPGQRRRAA